jgi:hypothetical protein
MFFPLALFLLAFQAEAAPSGIPGIKVTTRFTFDGRSSNERTEYFAGDRKRMEYRNESGEGKGAIHGPRLAAVLRCDLAKAFELNLDDLQYTEAAYPPQPLSPKEIQARGIRTHLEYVSDQPTLKVEINTVDTGERRQVFSHTARHVITTTKEIPLAGSKSQPSSTLRDGWYIDLDTRLSCDPKYPSGGQTYAFLTAGNGPIERRAVEIRGARETGFAIELRTTSRGTLVLPDDSKKEYSSVNESRITDLAEGPLDPGLFQVPPGFRLVDSIRRDCDGKSQTSSWTALKNWFRTLF